MGLESILKRAKKAAITFAFPFALLASGPILAQDSRPSRVTNTYRINAEELDGSIVTLTGIANFASARYTVNEHSGRYEITGSMRGQHSLYHSRMNFRVYGEIRDNKHFPQHYQMNFTHDSAMSHDGTTSTIIDFDYAMHRAYPYSRQVTRNRVLYDYRENGVEIDDSVKDIISGIMDIKASGISESTAINTLVSGHRAAYAVNYDGIQNIQHNGNIISCTRFSMQIPRNVIDRNPYAFTFWITQSRSRTPLKIKIQPGRSILWALHQSTRRD